MTYGKASLLFVSFLLVSVSALARQNSDVQSIILNDSKLRINGTSNVNDFECIYEESINPDTLRHNIQIEDNSISVKGDDISLTVDSFECGKKGINRDLRRTLKSDVYPNIEIELLSVVSPQGEPTLVNVATTLGGITKEYTIELRDYSFQDGLIIVSGTNKINMTDFNIEPPTVLFGLIKVRDEIDINFTLSIKQ